jgi:type II secretion system protein N
VALGERAVRRARILGIAAAGAVLTLLFLLLGFPYDLFAGRISEALSRASGVPVRLAHVGPYLSPFGPGLELGGLDTSLPDGARIAIERARVRPAWALSWLRAAPALRLDVAGPSGRIAGVATLGRAPGFCGRIAALDLEALPRSLLWPDASLRGTLDADVDLRGPADAPHGRVDLQGHAGNVGVPGVPIAIPFDELRASVVLGDDPRIDLESLTIESPLYSARAHGRLGAAPRLGAARLDLNIEIDAQPDFRPLLESLGLQPDPAGRVRLHVTGTPDAPQLR